MKILVVSHSVIGNDNGVGRVHNELIAEYRKDGHEVDKIDYLNFYPKGQNHFDKIFGQTIGEKTFKYLKKNAYKYDVIDANSECIISSKEEINFKGLLFLRSHGARALGERAEKIEKVAKEIKKEKATRTIKTRVGSFLRSLYRGQTIKEYYFSLKYADLVHCLSMAEFDFFKSVGIPTNRIIFIPNGMPAATLNSLQLIGEQRKLNPKIVSFIAGWRIMKGVKDWKEIGHSLIQIRGFKQILLLGTSWPEDWVKKDFESEALPFVKIVTYFKPAQLPLLLKDVRVGIFTSYTEGFCFAVIEQLAAGIPVVAYKVSGVVDVLSQVDSSLLFEPGDIGSLIAKAKQLLEMGNEEYQVLSRKCIEVSKRYALEALAPKYLQTFKNFLTANQ
jgi:glycosyltransferase involved in cell wall biosynthesis